ncbi:hypothetical protein IFR05_005255 [Cadophora sp. M221]|nr:hypothetical protein IFR05_005255 [Cadophora sp. M221]
MANAAQIESLRVILRAVDRYGEDMFLSEFCHQLAFVISEWQRGGGGGRADKPLTATLLQIMALITEEYQESIVLDAPERYPDPKVKANAAWLSDTF